MKRTSTFSKILFAWLAAALLTVCLALLSAVDDASAQEDVKAIHNLALESTQPGELEDYLGRADGDAGRLPRELGACRR